jgi:hypothetical protein
MDSRLKDELKKIIEEKVYLTNFSGQLVFMSDPKAWIFDFRKILLNGEMAHRVSEIFYERYKNEYPFQLGTLEVGGIPLLMTILNKFYVKGHLDMHGFFVRKSRKKTGLLHMVEGEVRSGVPIILVDDTMNSGNSFWRQISKRWDIGLMLCGRLFVTVILHSTSAFRIVEYASSPFLHLMTSQLLWGLI